MITQTANRKSWYNNKRLTALSAIGICIFLFLILIAADSKIDEQGLRTFLEWRNRPPDIHHIFGTDWLGRDMFTRVIKGMNLIGGGAKGVIIGVALTHWPSLARVIRAEVLQLMSADYITISSKLGHSPVWIARHHLLPHLITQCLVGFILLFPHAILHEAGMSFIGVGLPPHTPAVGIILSESMRHLSTGYWWLAVIPGACLLAMVKLFDILGEQVGDWINPRIIRS